VPLATDGSKVERELGMKDWIDREVTYNEMAQVGSGGGLLRGVPGAWRWLDSRGRRRC
jgi:hypothetical protein